jgi:hypothetical protein
MEILDFERWGRDLGKGIGENRRAEGEKAGGRMKIFGEGYAGGYEGFWGFW